MSKNKSESVGRNNNNNDEEVCVVCFRKAAIYSIGECDHPVCHECSTRMRVLCTRTECPICRKDMSVVVFTKKIQPFATIQWRNMKLERRYSIYFSTDEIMRAYDKLLDHSCPKCEGHPKFKNFNILKDHMKKIHEKFYCDLCVDNLKIFTKERRSYTRPLLAQHRRLGDTDDKSHRGHPLCEFCDSRFMDNDELFRHLRRDHFFCHFCDADGLHQYYDDYDALREHFGKDHYMCEEGPCREERFTSVYRTKLDLQAHTTQNHGHTMSKSEARQARTVDIAFTVNHRQAHFADRGRGGRKGEGRGRRPGQDAEEQTAAAASIPPSQMMTKQQQQRAIDINCVQNFPSLSGGGTGVGDGEGGGAGKSIAHKLAQQNRFTIRTTRGNALNNEEEFPRLGGVGPPPPTISGAAPPSHPTTSLHLSVNTKKAGGQFHNANGSSGPNVSIQYNCTNPSFAATQQSNHHQGNATGEKEKLKPRIGAVSHSGNITLRNSAGLGTRPKSTTLEEEFPSLQKGVQSGVVQTTAASWVTSKPNASSEKPKTKATVNSTAVSGGPNKDPSNKTSSSSNKNNNANLFESSDFPSLASHSSDNQQKLNYSGRSSLTIAMKKALVNEEKNDNDDNSGSGKGKKKKKNPTVKGNVETVSKPGGIATTTITTSATTPDTPNAFKTTTATKKKQMVFHNLFTQEYDPNEPQEDFSKGRKGEYESVAPIMSSNIKLLTSKDHSTSPQNRKKSELQIGTLKAPEFSSKDFPSLHLGGGPVNKGPKKFDKHTFGSSENDSDSHSAWGQAPSQSSKKRPAIPPGFSKKSQSSALQDFTNTDMTFTSSLGQKFAISPTTNSSSKSESPKTEKKTDKKSAKSAASAGFSLPPNFEQRNKVLIDAICEACEGNGEKFNRFKHLAEIFRSGELGGREYYEKCRQVMGKKVFHGILPELLALLPDIDKQQAVLEAYRKVDGAQGCATCFAVCAVCQQVLVSDDFPMHMTSHEFPTSDYPSLKTPSGGVQRRK